MCLFVNQAYSADKSITLNVNNSCVLDSAVNENSMRNLKKCVVDKIAKRRFIKTPIYIYVNSPGGSVYDGIKLITFLKNFDNVHTITEFAASMAAAIVQGNPGKRYGVDHSVSMFHRARGGFRGQFEDGELEKRLRLWKTIVRGMEQMQANRIGITLREYKKRRKDEWWLFGKENINSNVLDEIVRVKCSKKLRKMRVKTTVRTFFGSRKVEKSACPVLN